MNFTSIQQGIMNWFLLKPQEVKTAYSLRVVCNHFYEQHIGGIFSGNYKYEIIHPLLKWGVIECYDRHSYRLSPSTALQKGSNIFVCNIPTTHGNNASWIFDSGFGIEVCKNTPLMRSNLTALGLDIHTFKLSDLLSNISLNKIVDSWPTVKVLESKRYLYFDEDNLWEKISTLKVGVYKTNSEIYANRQLMIAENNWRIISNNWNDFAIAVLWSKIQKGYEFKIQFRKRDEILCLYNEYFPLLIERLLLINSLLEGKFPSDYNKREYFIRAKDFSDLNKIFRNRISVV